MSKRNITEELLSNLGFAEAELSEKELTLSGAGSSFYASDCETDENKKFFDPDTVCYASQDNTTLQRESCKPTASSEKSEESKKVLESA